VIVTDQVLRLPDRRLLAMIRAHAVRRVYR